MITLTNPELVKTILGGSATTAYDKLVLSSITYNVLTGMVDAQVRVTSTANLTMTPRTGTLKINTATQKLVFEIDQMDTVNEKTLTGPQNAQVQTLITNAQNALESGLITVAVVDGVQSTGT